jgi:hypothetical protein
MDKSLDLFVFKLLKNAQSKEFISLHLKLLFNRIDSIYERFL